MKLKFCGAAGTTTGSQHLLEINGKRILLDCGFYQGRRHEAYERNRRFEFYDPASLDAVVLSHAHIDHSGNLPHLVKRGYEGNIFSTFATRDLCQVMLPDAAKIQAQDLSYINRKRKKKGLHAWEPLYNFADAERCIRSFVNIGYDRTMPIADGVTLTFIDAGHILGSAQVVLDLHEFETGIKKRFLFSGDVGRGENILLRDPDPCDDVDFLLMESTYGGREHELPTKAHDKLCEILNRALETGGKIIIPAFAVERTQQLLYSLYELFTDDCIPEVPVFVDSPMAVNATEVFRLHPECFNDDVYANLFEKRDMRAFEHLTLIRSVEESKALNKSKKPAIIIAASGMCEAGRVLHHLRNNIEDPKTTILFVGYCAQNTLGWKIRERWDKVRIFGDEFRLRAQVEILDSFSGHADHSELLDYFDRIGGAKEKIWLVHGEPDRSAALAEALASHHASGKTQVAELGAEVEF